MQRRIIVCLYIALVVLLVPAAGASQSRAWINSAEAEKVFVDGLAAYRAEHFAAALDPLAAVVGVSP